MTGFFEALGGVVRHVVVGGGVIGEVIIAARVAAGDDVTLVETDANRAQQVAAKHPIQLASLAEAVGAAAVIWLAVKPQQLPEVLVELDSLLANSEDHPLAISLAAGTNTTQIAQLAPNLLRVVRVMPNTPARIGRGVTAIATPPLAPGTFQTTPEDLALTASLLAPLGAVVEAPETLIDAVTVVAGSGPAYLFYLAEAMTEAGVSLGLDQSLSKQLVAETLAGASELLRASGIDAKQLREDVTSRAGVTFAATSYMDDHQLKDEIVTAIKVAHARAKELGEESTRS